MILDERTEFCDNLAVDSTTGTTLEGDVIDLTDARDIGQGQPIYLVIQVTVAFTSSGSATVDFQLRSDSIVAIHATDSTAHLSTGPVPFATLALGYRIVIPVPPQGDAYERYLGLQLVTGAATTTAGSINAFLTTEPSVIPTTSYPDAVN